MVSNSLHRLRFLCDTIPGLLNKIDEEEFSRKEKPEKWSKKEILGHLIDSATNNHQRFVRVQFESNPEIEYNQDNWNRFSFHQQVDSHKLISFWLAYNRHLVELIANLPEESLSLTCSIRGNLVSLQYLIDDYVVHMEHHLRQIRSY